MERENAVDTATPDFYDYPWMPIDSATIRGRFLHLEWPDGAALEAFDLWLCENAIGLGIDPATREGLIDPADHHAGTRVVDATLLESGAIEVTFSNSQGAHCFHPGWLHHVATGSHSATSWLPPSQPWLASEMVEPPTHDGPAVLSADDGDTAFCAWINNLVGRGIARLRNLPSDPNVALVLASKIGAVRDTNFGAIWDVKADVALAGNADTNSTANTNLRLGPHTDLPTRETPPGFQFLHCFANEAEGGNSTMADGAAVVQALQAEHPDHYNALTTLRWVFFNRGPGIDHRWSGPMIDLGVDGSPLTLRAFYPVRGFPDMAPDDVPRAYEAMKVFSQLAASDRFQIDYPFEPGDMVGFDNRRILHGRNPFSAGGHRHLRGIYIDHDDVLSATRVANRRAATRKSNEANNA